MTHICIKDEGKPLSWHLGCYERTTALGGLYAKFSSTLAILWLAFHISRVHTQSEIKCHTSPEVTQSLPMCKVSKHMYSLVKSKKILPGTSFNLCRGELDKVYRTTSVYKGLNATTVLNIVDDQSHF